MWSLMKGTTVIQHVYDMFFGDFVFMGIVVGAGAYMLQKIRKLINVKNVSL